MGLRKLFPCLKNREPQKVQNGQQTPGKQQPAQKDQPKETPDKQTNESSGNQPPKLPSIGDLPTKDGKGTETTTQETPSQAQEGPANPRARSVWNRAYDELENDDGTRKLVEAYMKAVKKASKPAGDASAPEADEDISEIKDQVERDRILKGAIKSGQERIHKSTSATNTVGKVSNFVLKFKDVVDFAVATNPQAALPWAGVCIGLTFLLNPAKASQDNLEGIGYVTSRMEWYCKLTDELLSREYIDTSKSQSFKGVLDLLEGRVVDLYKELLLFQMKSVCSYYKNQGWVFIRNLINLDGWDGQLDGVKEAENAVKQDSEQYYNIEGQTLMRNLAQDAQATQETLGNFHQTLQDYIAEQRQTHQDDELGNCLRDLFVTDPQAQMATKLSTSDRLLPDSYKWILHTKEYQALQDWESPSQVLWLYGPAGTGKTMLNIGIISEMFGRSSNVTASISYYFCEARGENQTPAMDVLRTLIWGLLIQQPHLFSHLKDLHKSSGAAMFTAPNTFWYLRDKFLAILADERLTPVYLVIDALDECEDEYENDEPGVQDLIEMVSESLEIANSSAKIKWLLSSRPEIDLPSRLTKQKPETLKQVDVQSRPEPVDAYITHKISQLKQVLQYEDEKLKEVENEIRTRAQNTFLWAALVFKDLFTRRVKDYAALEEIKKTPAKLSKLYERMMVRIEKGDHPDLSKSVLEVACFASRPLSYAEIHVLSGLPSGYPPEDFVSNCGSFLTVENETVHLLHNSARQHLMDYFKSRSTKIHDLICDRSLAALSEGLMSNIYTLLPETEISDVVAPQNDPLARLAYSCEYWVESLGKGTGKLTDDGSAFAFLKVHFLHWLESLSLLGKLPKAVVSIRNLQAKTKSAPSGSSELLTFLDDAERFTMKNLTVMMQFPLQIYGSALLFSPRESVIKNMFYGEKPPFIGKFAGGVDHWDPCRQTLDGGPGTKALSFSPDNKCFASALITDNHIIVKIWDAAIGDCIRLMQINEGGDGVVIAFSLDSKRLAVASKNKVRLMDINTGACRHTIELPGCVISSIAFSLDGNSFALAADCTVQLWDVSTWTHRRTLEGHTKSVNSVTFAPNSEILATGSDDRTARLWNHIDGTCEKVIKGFYSVQHAFFSADSGTLILLAYYLQLWDVSSGTLKVEHSTDSYSDDASLSSDGKVIALTSVARTMLQNVVTGETIQTFHQEGFSGRVAFSKNKEILISSSSDGLVRVWDISGPPTKSSDGHAKEVSSLRFSQNGDLLATGSEDKTVKLWNLTDGNLRHTLERHEKKVNFVVFAPDGKTLASLSPDKTVRVWETVTGSCRHILECIAGENDKQLMKVIMESLLGGTDDDDNDDDDDDIDGLYNAGKPVESNAATFSPDGSTLAVDAGLGRVMLWDVVTGECKQTLEGDMGFICWLWFLRNGRTLVIGAMETGAELWDLDTGTCEQKFTEPMSAMCLSSDGTTLVSGSAENALRVWDVATGVCQQTVDVGHETGNISFIDGDKYLKTDRGTFSFTSGVLANTPDAELSRSGVWIEEKWVFRDGKKLFALPPDYPSRLTTVYKNTLALGGLSGEVAFVEFANC